MATTANEHELMGLEREFWDAIKAKDGRKTARMTDDKCIVVGAQGVSAIDPKTMEKLTVEGEWTLQQYTFDEQNAQVRFVNDDVAIVAYKVKESLIVEGRPLSLEAADSSTWIRSNGRWLCAQHVMA